MNYFDNENNIIEFFQSIDNKGVCFCDKSKTAKQVFKLIHNVDNWGNWTHNFKKNNPPPDYFSDEYSMMMEVMRVDDHTHYDDNGRLINPVNIRESIIQKEMREEIIRQQPEIDISNVNIIVNAISGLESTEDHNYSFYKDNFERVLKKHIEKIPQYRKNHPNKKLIFFVFDESTGYIDVKDEDIAREGPKIGKQVYADVVFHFYDSNFINVIKDTDIDYMVWVTPFKQLYGVSFQLPKICVFDIRNNKWDKIINYPEKCIVSTEA